MAESSGANPSVPGAAAQPVAGPGDSVFAAASKAGRAFLKGGGVMGAQMRAMDWSRTPLGPPEKWPQSLKTVVRIMLDSRYAMWMGYGPELTFFCNDAYRPTLGTKQSWALGAPSRQVWAEIWADIAPRLKLVFNSGEGTWDESLLLFLERSGYPEETYHTFSYSPIFDDSGTIGGHLCVVTEVTDRIIGERRLALLRESASELAGTKTEAEALAAIKKQLTAEDRDFPFTLTYLLDGEGAAARLASTSGIDPNDPAAPLRIEGSDPWPLAQVLDGNAAVLVNDLRTRFDTLPTGAWDRAPAQAIVVPIPQQGQARPAGVFIAGLNPYRPLDEAYRGFIELFTNQLAAALANARAYEETRRRTEALAELDRAKTEFFSNVSHEFRTPLTLMLAPLEDLLAQRDPSPVADRETLSIIHRNGLRLLKLVNTLLDFSRIEAGRARAVYQPVDLCAYTTELAGVFRSAIEKAGLSLTVECDPLDEPIYVDRDMWEKIVLNLLSNAFKFTLEGGITVSIRLLDHQVELKVKDTGTGIPESELPRIFDRFHRVSGARGRTHEGTGVGLSLVQELTPLHGGGVSVTSTPGQGSVFSVVIPRGTAHLPADQLGQEQALASTSLGATPFIEEARGWLADDVAAGPADDPSTLAQSFPGGRPRVLLADDNADMRQYVKRLLEATCDVEAVEDGQAAYEAAAAHRPELILSDIMMPRMDGFELIRQIRANPTLADTPIILLSARAGEESRVEGMDAGADDYLVKPFSSRELRARVRAHVQMSRIRREISEQLRRAKDAAEKANSAKDNFLAALSHELRTPLTPVLMAVQALESDPALSGEIHADLAMIRRNVQLEARLIDDLLDLTRVARGKISLCLEHVDLHTVVLHALETCRESDIEPRRINVELDLEATRPIAHVDAARIEQVFWNLIKNAAKFTEPGGSITLRSRDRDDKIVIEVIDTGAGISPELMSTLFNAFEQGGNEITRRYGGLGLGLAISRAIIELHHGTISAASEGSGRGATFSISLQRAAVPVEPVAPPAEEKTARNAGPLRILLVEDHENTLELMARMLRNAGHDICTASGVDQALEQAANGSFDLVISDLGLPDGSGHDLMRQLRERYNLKGIALSGYGMEEDIQASREAGFDTHIVKPVNFGMLSSAITRVSNRI